MKNLKDITDLNEIANIIKNYIINTKLSEDYLINFDCPIDILTMLVNDSNVLVRKLGVQNKNCSVQTLERIIKFDSNSTIKKTAIQNPNCSFELLDRLLMDSDFFIRDAAKKRLDSKDKTEQKEIKKGKHEEELDNMIAYYNELKEIEKQKEKQNKPKVMADPNELAAARRMATQNVGRLNINNDITPNENANSNISYTQTPDNLVQKSEPATLQQSIDAKIEINSESEEDRLFEAEIERELEQEEKSKSPSKLLITIDKLKRSNKTFVRKFYHSIKIDNDTFLTKVDDHYEIKSEFLSVLNFLNLENIDTNNLKVCGIDISESNLKIDPQLIYNKDLSNTTLDDKNLASYNFDGVNMEGTNVGVKKY